MLVEKRLGKQEHFKHQYLCNSSGICFIPEKLGTYRHIFLLEKLNFFSFVQKNLQMCMSREGLKGTSPDVHERLVITEQAWALFSFQNCDMLYCISQSFEENLVKKRMSISRICLGKCFTQQQQQQPDCVCFNRQGMLQCRASQHLDDKVTKRHNTPGGKTVVYANRCSHSLLDAPDSLGAERYES